MTYQEYPPVPTVPADSPVPPQAPPAYGTEPYAVAAPAYGTPPYSPAPPYYAAPPKMNILAVIAFVAAFMVPVAAIVLGHISLSQLKRSGEQGRGLAIAGLVIGYVDSAFYVVLFLVWLALVLGLVASHGFSTSA
jgi:hypothetical protein